MFIEPNVIDEKKSSSNLGCCRSTTDGGGCCRSTTNGEGCICTDTVELKHIHGPDCGHVPIKHDNHIDFNVEGRLHHIHDAHCDDHGEIRIVGHSNDEEYIKYSIIDESIYTN